VRISLSTEGGRGAWVALPVDSTESTDICLDGDHERSLNLGLAKLLSILDDAEQKLRVGELAESC
jgi:hypothetical protein